MSIPVDKDLEKIISDEKKPKKRETEIRPKTKFIEEEILDKYDFIYDRIQIEDSYRKEGRLEYDDDDHLITLHLKSRYFLELPENIYVTKREIEEFSLEIETGYGTINTICKETGGHKIQGDDENTYFMLDEPGIDFTCNITGKTKNIYNKFARAIELNKEDISHYHNVFKDLEIAISNRYYPTIIQEEREVNARDKNGKVIFDTITVGEGEDAHEIERPRRVQGILEKAVMTARHQRINFTITEIDQIKGFIDLTSAKKYKDSLAKSKESDYNKYVREKAKAGINQDKETFTYGPSKKTGIDIISYRKNPGDLVDITLYMAIADEKQYKIIKKMFEGTVVYEINIELQLRSGPKKEVKPKITLPVRNTTAMGVPMGVPKRNPQNFVGIPVRTVPNPNIPMGVPRRVVQQPVRVEPAPVITTVPTEQQPIVRMEEETSPATETNPTKGLSLTDFIKNLKK